MKSSIRVINLDNKNVSNNIKMALANEAGVLACEIKSQQGKIDIIYDEYYLKEDDILDIIENLGYSTL